MTRIQLRLGAALAGLVAVAVLASGYLAERSLRQQELDELHRSMEARARLVREMMAETPIDASHRAELQELALRAGRSADARITLIAPDGAVVADSEVRAEALASVENHGAREEVAAALAGRASASQRFSRTIGRPLLYVGVPAAHGGVVRLAVDLASIDAQAAALRQTLLAAGGVAIGLALALGVVLAGRIVRPLRELRDFLAGLARGEPYHRLPWRSPDEFGQIASAVDEVANRLQGRIAALTSEQAQLRAVLHGMVEGVLVVDRGGHVVLANRRLRELFGVWGDVAGRSALEVIRRTEVEAILERATAEGDPVVAEFRAGEDGERVVLVHAGRFPENGHAGTVAVFHDVTELRRLERVRKEFVANISHELKTPLTAIRGFAETLQGNALEPAQRSHYLDVVLRHAARLTSLIEDLLELSRIEGRQEAVDRTEVSLEPLVREILADMGPRLTARQLENGLVAKGEVRALTDRRVLEQVLVNLLDNAVKYTDPGGRIQVALSADGERARIEVSDTGIGIPDADRPRIFERFYRVDKARSRDLGGTGLGLSIVKHLVQAMGGEVFVESQEGKGSTFSVLLPAA